MKRQLPPWMWMTVLLLWLVSTAVWAGEIFQYTDKDGNMIFTDDYNRVPKEKQADVKTFRAIETKSKPSDSTQIQNVPGSLEAPPADTSSAPGDTPESNAESETVPETGTEPEFVEEEALPSDEEPLLKQPSMEESMGPESSAESSPLSDIEVMKGQFDREKKELDRKLERLQKEKQALADQDVSQMNSWELNAHEERVKDINARIEGYQKEQRRFEQRVSDFNERIMNQNKMRAAGETADENK